MGGAGGYIHQKKNRGEAVRPLETQNYKENKIKKQGLGTTSRKGGGHRHDDLTEAVVSASGGGSPMQEKPRK